MRPLLLLVVIAGAVLGLDMWTKRWATAHLAYRQPVEVVGEFVRLTYTRNSGIAFGLGAGKRFPYYVFSIAAAVVILYLFARQRVHHLPRQVALALILGGALGNLVDRLKTGEVVDFIEIGWDRWHWPVFNVADSAVTIGVVLFALVWSHKEPANEAGPGAPRLVPAYVDEPNPGPHGSGAEPGRAVGPIPGRGADRPLS